MVNVTLDTSMEKLLSEDRSSQNAGSSIIGTIQLTLLCDDIKSVAQIHDIILKIISFYYLFKIISKEICRDTKYGFNDHEM